MSEINVFYYKTKIGELIIGSYENKLCLLDFRWRRMRTTVDNRIKKELQAEFVEKETKLIIKTKKQIDEYLEGKRKKFDIPLLTVGTDFQKQVWKELMNIPYGQTVSYLDLANKINNPKAVRAVASANGANAISVIIPCHRVINSNGELGGYGGGLAVKKRLLKIEKENGK
ncbi:methylated-DNA--[protein]-cysteine S-methyltransferase [Oceanivirga salmonicida]|uniref:methylated-DNA--[protein]-cysteine S-methyltransferase n=1 Tax=Oceanivirga salmonicida TaxID=1769291 RepID=UPI0012E2D1D0|nr:methylated-DNA--[protein]-cysteine S-methyltransferase [Oceanivirga salmonicida]